MVVLKIIKNTENEVSFESKNGFTVVKNEPSNTNMQDADTKFHIKHLF